MIRILPMPVATYKIDGKDLFTESQMQSYAFECQEAANLSKPNAQTQHKKLWLWKNFVDGRPEYWAFDNPYPKNLDDGDPQTLGQPCGYAIFKESRDGSCGRTEEQVLREMKNVAPPQHEWQGLTDEEYEAMAEKYVTNCYFDTLKYARAIEQKLKGKNT